MKRSACSNPNQPKIKCARLTDFFKTSSKVNEDVESKAATCVFNDSDTLGSPTLINDASSSRPRGKQRQFQSAWIKELPWIKYDENEIASCSICAKYPSLNDQSSKVVRGFTAPFKLETFKKHGISQQHLKCVAALKAETEPNNTALAKCVKKIDEKMFNHLKVVFNAAYYLAKKNRPFTDIKDTLTLISNCGVEVLQEYSNNNSCKEIISHISSTIEEDLLAELKQCRFLSILLDGSTDKSDEEQLVVYVRYLKDNAIKEIFLGIIPLENGTSEAYLSALKQLLKKAGLEMLLQPNSPLIGIGTDGAAAMVGKENGLVTTLGTITGMEHLISIHCVAHRLNLAVLSSIKGAKYLSKIDCVLKQLYKFYQNSPKRLKQLKKVAEALETEILKFQYLHNVRWVASKVNALTALIKNYSSVVIHLEEVSNGVKEEAAIAKGLLKDLKSFRFVKFVHFLLDFLRIINSLSLLFQKSDQLLPLINLHVQKAQLNLEALKSTCGEMENLVVSNTTLDGKFKEIQLTKIDTNAFENDKQSMLEDGIQFLKKRFLETSTIADAFAVFDTFQWPDGKDLFNYGESKIKTLGLHYMKFLSSKDKTEEEFLDDLLIEWFNLKTIGKNLNIEQLLQKTEAMKDRFPNLSSLLKIVAVIPVSTASCERGFSHMNLIKSKLRNRLEVDSMQNLLMINLNGPELESFNPDKAVDHWYFKTKAVRHVEGHKRKA